MAFFDTSRHENILATIPLLLTYDRLVKHLLLSTFTVQRSRLGLVLLPPLLLLVSNGYIFILSFAACLLGSSTFHLLLL